MKLKIWLVGLSMLAFVPAGNAASVGFLLPDGYELVAFSGPDGSEAVADTLFGRSVVVVSGPVGLVGIHASNGSADHVAAAFNGDAEVAEVLAIVAGSQELLASVYALLGDVRALAAANNDSATLAALDEQAAQAEAHMAALLAFKESSATLMAGAVESSQAAREEALQTGVKVDAMKAAFDSAAQAVELLPGTLEAGLQGQEDAIRDSGDGASAVLWLVGIAAAVFLFVATMRVGLPFFQRRAVPVDSGRVTVTAPVPKEAPPVVVPDGPATVGADLADGEE